MRLVVISVAQRKDKIFREATEEFLGRVRRYVPVDEIELPDGPAAKLEPAIAKAAAGATLVAMEVLGRPLQSEEFARRLERHASTGKGVVAFLIGGADGIPEATSRAAADRISLSSLTFPHRLAKLVLVEQLYRAMTILRGEPYAH